MPRRGAFAKTFVDGRPRARALGIFMSPLLGGADGRVLVLKLAKLPFLKRTAEPISDLLA